MARLLLFKLTASTKGRPATFLYSTVYGFVQRMQPSLDQTQLPNVCRHLSITGFPKLPSPQADMHQLSRFFLRVTQSFSDVFDLFC